MEMVTYRSFFATGSWWQGKSHSADFPWAFCKAKGTEHFILFFFCLPRIGREVIAKKELLSLLQESSLIRFSRNTAAWSETSNLTSLIFT